MDTIRVGLYIRPPYVNPCVIEDPKNCSKPGINFEVFHSLMTVLKFNYQVVEVKERSSYIDSNGSWHGVIGMLYRNEIDIAGITSIQSRRLNLVKFTNPITYVRYAYIIKRPVNVDKSMSLKFLLDAITPNVMAIFASLLLAVATIATFATLIDTGQWRPAWSNLFRNIFCAYRSTVNQTNIDAKLITVRLVFSCWQIAMFVVVSVYSGGLYSAMVKRESAALPFRSLNELAVLIYQGKISLLTSSMAFLHNVHHHNLTQGESWKTLSPLQMIKESLNWNPPIVVKSNQEIISRLLSDPMVTYWGSSFRLNQIIANNCDLVLIEETIEQPFFLAFSVLKNGPLLELLDAAILGVEGSAIDDYLVRLYASARYKTPRRCDEPTNLIVSLLQNNKPLQLSQCQGAFWMLVWGLIIATSIIVIERVKTMKKS